MIKLYLNSHAAYIATGYGANKKSKALPVLQNARKSAKVHSILFFKFFQDLQT